MNNTQVAKNFVKYAQQGIHKTGKGSNFYFCGNKLYSYGQHWIVAEYDEELGKFILNESPVSSTTNRHTSEAYSAIPYNKMIRGKFAKQGMYGNNSETLDAKQAIAVCKYEIAMFKQKEARARKDHTRDHYAYMQTHLKTQKRALTALNKAWNA